MLILKLLVLLFIVDISLRFVGYAQIVYRKRKFKKQTNDTQKRLPTLANGDIKLLNPLDLISLSQVFQLDPQKKYIFWWKQLLPDKHSEFIERSLKRLGLDFRILVGPGQPNIYEMKGGTLQKLEPRKPVIAPPKEKERREFDPTVDKPIQ